MIVMFAAVFPAVIGTGEDGLKGQELAKARIEAGMEHVHLTYIVATIGGLAMMGMFLGYTLWARLLQGDDKKGNALVIVASIAMPVAAAGMMMSMDFNFAAAAAWIDGDKANAALHQPPRRQCAFAIQVPAVAVAGGGLFLVEIERTPRTVRAAVAGQQVERLALVRVQPLGGTGLRQRAGLVAQLLQQAAALAEADKLSQMAGPVATTPAPEPQRIYDLSHISDC